MDSKNHKINEFEILLTVVWALATHQVGPGLNPEVDATCELSLLFDLEGADMFQPVFKECSVWVDNYKKYSLNRSYALRLRLNRKIQRELWATKTAPNSKPSLYVRPTKKEIKKISNLFTSLTVIKRTSLL